MEDIDKFRWWIGQHPYLAGGLGFWVFCTIFGRWQPKRETAERWPRALVAVLIARDIGLAISRLGKPLVAFFAPPAARDLVRAFYGDEPSKEAVARNEGSGS